LSSDSVLVSADDLSEMMSSLETSEVDLRGNIEKIDSRDVGSILTTDTQYSTSIGDAQFADTTHDVNSATFDAKTVTDDWGWPGDSSTHPIITDTNVADLFASVPLEASSAVFLGNALPGPDDGDDNLDFDADGSYQNQTLSASKLAVSNLPEGVVDVDTSLTAFNRLAPDTDENALVLPSNEFSSTFFPQDDSTVNAFADNASSISADIFEDTAADNAHLNTDS